MNCNILEVEEDQGLHTHLNKQIEKQKMFFKKIAKKRKGRSIMQSIPQGEAGKNPKRKKHCT